MVVESSSSAFYRQAGWIVWLTLAVGITLTVMTSMQPGHDRTVVNHYRNSSLDWFAGQPLYSMTGHGYLYFPQGALVFAPFAFLPEVASELSWRWCMIFVAALSVSALTRLLNGDGRWFFVITIASVVLGMGSARIGQSTLMITGLNILAVTELSKRRWWRATILLTLSLAIKPLTIVLILLVAALHPRMSYRLAIGLLLLIAIPFITQQPEYVISQYQACFESLKMTYHVGETEYWAQLFGMLKVVGIILPEFLRTAIRMFAAVLTLFACWQAVKRLSLQQSSFYLCAFAAFYVMLFNARTEGNTYSMVGPVYGALISDSAFRLKSRKSTAWLVVATVFTLLHFEFGKLVTPVPREVWVSPLICCGVTGYLVYRLTCDLQDASMALGASGETPDESAQSFGQSAA